MEIQGSFTIQGFDKDRTRYHVTFRPEAIQHWSLHSDGFTAELNEDHVHKLFADQHREPELGQARSEGSVQFHGSISAEDYAKYAGP